MSEGPAHGGGRDEGCTSDLLHVHGEFIWRVKVRFYSLKPALEMKEDVALLLDADLKENGKGGEGFYR